MLVKDIMDHHPVTIYPETLAAKRACDARSDSQLPPCEDYLYRDPEYPIEAYASSFSKNSGRIGPPERWVIKWKKPRPCSWRRESEMNRYPNGSSAAAAAPETILSKRPRAKVMEPS